MQYHPFDALIFEDTTTLVLGSFPSIASFEEGFYYAHKRNQFWPLLNAVFNEDAITIEEKKALCEKHKIGLFDVAKSVRRSKNDSSDTNLSQIEVHDFEKLLERFPCIKRIVFTGKKAQALFDRHCKGITIEKAVFPSPSAAYAAMPFEEKLLHYRALLL